VWRIRSCIVISRTAGTVAGICTAVAERRGHLHARELRQVLAHRLVHHEPAFLVQHQRAHRHERLRHRRDAEDRVPRHGRARSRIQVAERLEIARLAVASDKEHRARQRARRNFGIERGSDALEPVRERPSELWSAGRGECHV
jgi:hypothetical protein